LTVPDGPPVITSDFFSQAINQAQSQVSPSDVSLIQSSSVKTCKIHMSPIDVDLEYGKGSNQTFTITM
jgi:hypothetical protein